ncbi:MAG TPA: glycogen synthase GlgA [Gammaproteobacteria bacterium]
MKILFVTSEAHPLVKTGGLGDVGGSLPGTLTGLGQAVRLVLPAYHQAVARLNGHTLRARLSLPGSEDEIAILEGTLPGSEVTVWLIDAPLHFNRAGGPYGTSSGDWPDNAERFALFARAVVELAMDRAGLDWQPDLVHCNDWQTGLVPALLAQEEQRPATLFTIHNLAYQGLFPWETFERLALPRTLWHMEALEFHGQLSFIKGGLVFADRLTTVSPTYAREIRTAAFGYGLEGLLNHRADRLSGILNGADYEIWDPARDPLIPAHFSAADLSGKARNKAALQHHFGLAERGDVPLLGVIGRMVEQKGIDLIAAATPNLISAGAQLAILGSGLPHFEQLFRELAARYPHRIGLHIGYDEPLAHLIEAGADLFLMPSRFEPCGLNQIYSLRYGTLPVVRHTGGLADTVVDTGTATLKAGTATGFVIEAASSEALTATVRRALGYYRQPKPWQQLIGNAMAQDFSWHSSARDYLALYRLTIEEHSSLSG